MNRTQIEVSEALVKGERNYLPLGMNPTTNETEDSVETRRRMLEDRLLGELIFKVSDEEWKGLTLLVRALEDSPRCRVTERGCIIVGFDDEVEVGLDVRETVMRKESLSRVLERNSTFMDHLVVYARSVDSGISKRVCITSSDSYHEETPATDKCVAFVLWANDGFRDPPMTLIDAVEYCKDPEGLRELEESYEDRRRQRILEMYERDEAISRERDLKSTRELQEWRLERLGWRDIMQEHKEDTGEDTLESVIARGIRTSILVGVSE